MIKNKKVEIPGIALPSYWLRDLNEQIDQEEGNTMEQFLNRHKDKISGTLSGFDRMLFRGTFQFLSYVEGMQTFLNHHVLLKDFGTFVQKHSELIKTHAESFAHRHNRPYQYINCPSASKENIAKTIMTRDKITQGLICVLSCVEVCKSYGIRKNKMTHKIELISDTRKCQHFYFYFIDKEFGFMHVRLQSWFPCPIQVCINGREWLARKMGQAGIGYQRRENCFTHIDDFSKAQKLADTTVNRHWPKILNSFAKRFNPLLAESTGLDLRGYYWTIRQAEYATDIIFKNPALLKELYPKLVHHAIEHFSSEDVLRFLGRRLHGNLNAEVLSDTRRRTEGLRIKHWVDDNSIKMYDKQQYVLRIETTINNPKDFKVYRDVLRNRSIQKAWVPMRKSVADILPRVDVSRAANSRYLDALAVIGDQHPSHQLLDQVSSPIQKNNRRYRPLHPIAPQDSLLFQSIMHGGFLIRGFRNKDLRLLLFPNPISNEQLNRDISRTSRLISLLRAHHLVNKVPYSRLYRISNNGQRVMSTALIFRNSDIACLQQCT